MSVETWNGEVKVIGNWVWLDFQQSWIEMYTTDRHLEGTHNIKVKNYEHGNFIGPTVLADVKVCHMM